MPLPPIDYAPKPSSLRVRPGRALAAILLAMAAAAWWCGPRAWRQARALYWQHRCMTYTQPADRVVYDEGPTAAALVAGGNGYAWYAGPPMHSWAPPPAAIVAANCWMTFGRLVSTGTRPGGATLFCHELRSAAGARRLVVIEHAPAPESQKFLLGYDVAEAEYDPATLTRPPRWVTSSHAIRVTKGPIPSQHLRIYAGQADPADAAHFTIRYEM